MRQHFLFVAHPFQVGRLLQLPDTELVNVWLKATKAIAVPTKSFS
jgi:hypothetical protein